MAFIDVDRSRLDSTARAIDNYVRNHRNKMNSANAEVNALSSSYQGSDFNEFRKQWNRVTERGSTSQKMIAAMENYANFLRFASDRYRIAQANAISHANGIR